MTLIRPAAVAGAFYPGDPRELGAMVRDYLSQVPKSENAVPKAIIAPHAGFVYSGLTAAHAYAPIEAARARIKRVVLLGPCHRVAVQGLALSSADHFATPLGDVAVDREAAKRIEALPQVKVFDATHADEHSLEVHLPFLQTVLGDFKLVPLVVGQAGVDEVAEVLDMLWGGAETLIVISTDLTHYLAYDAACSRDAETRAAIEALDADAIADDQACGRTSVKGLLKTAKRRGMKVATADVRNSGDTAGPRDKVVGYGSWLLWEPPGNGPGKGPGNNKGAEEDSFGAETRELLAAHGPALLKLSGQAIRHYLGNGRQLGVKTAGSAAAVTANGASFVSLDKDGKLRGCVGSIGAWRPLIEDVAENAVRAAFKDSRFKPLTQDEIDNHHLALTVSVLSPQAPIGFSDEADLIAQLRPGVDGVVLQEGKQRGVFLPVVWEQVPEPATFLKHLKRKAGLAEDYWSDSLRAWRYVTETVSSESLPDPRAVWQD